MSGVEIAGLGHYAPQRIVANPEIEQRLGLGGGWIERRTGILERRYVADDEALSDMAVNAGESAIAASGMARDDIRLVLLATSTPDHLLPPSAPLVAHRLGLPRAGGIDLAGACGGFLYALSLADSFVRAQHVSVLVIAANVLSRRINVSDRASSVLFADAAGAVLLRPSDRANAGMTSCELASSGEHYGLIHIAGGGSRKPFAQIDAIEDTLMVIENGARVYTEAVAMMTGCAEVVLSKANVTASDIAHFVPHQANERMMQAVAKQLGMPDDKVLSSIAHFGNSSAATIPFTLSREAARRTYRDGERILMAAAGAGLTGGAIVWTV